MSDARTKFLADLAFWSRLRRPLSGLAADFAAKTRSAAPIEERARLGIAPAMISIEELSRLMEGEPRDPGDTITAELLSACVRTILKATASSVGLGGGVLSDRVTFFVHRDNARRYLASLDLHVPAGSPLWCWLRAKCESDAGQQLPCQEDKADFQQLCAEHWKINTTARITGDAGVVKTVGRSYLNKYKEKTLERWAREVAPDEVSKKRGRPKKSS